MAYSVCQQPSSANKIPIYYLVIQLRKERMFYNYYKGMDPDFCLPKSTCNSPKRRVVIVKAKILPKNCLPSKVKRSEGGVAWRKGKSKQGKQQRASPAGRPALLLPPMRCTGAPDDHSPPVVATRVQEANAFHALDPGQGLQEPSAPSPGPLFYNSEDHSDLTFIVGEEGWRFPAHSFIFDRQQNTLAALLQASQADARTPEDPMLLKLPHMRPELFEQLLRYVYTGQASLSSVDGTLSLLQLSQAYHLPQLASLCLAHLTCSLTSSNVLCLLNHLLCQPDNNNETTAHNDKKELLFRCFQVVDSHADEILHSDDFETLEHGLLVEIVQRDTLAVSSESVVFESLMRWACRACKRQRKELTSESKCEVVGTALFLVRYLTMSEEEFLRGPVSQGVLTKEDKDLFLARLQAKEPSFGDDLPDRWKGLKVGEKRKAPVVISESKKEVVQSPVSNAVQPVKNAKKKSMSKKLLNGVGDLVICVIQLLD